VSTIDQRHRQASSDTFTIQWVPCYFQRVEQQLTKPRALKPGDTIGIAAPASPFDREAFDRGIAVLESIGFRVQIPEGLFARNGYLAGSDTERAALLMGLFEDDSIGAIFCARGGFGSMRLLPLLDFDTICSHPKVIVGFSDITALLVAIYNRCSTVTFHGPLVTTLGKGSKQTRSALVDTIASPRPLNLRPHKAIVVNAGKASGPLLGGNLTSLCHLMGTHYEPSFESHLLFLEDRGEAPYRIDRMLSQLRLGGHLDGVAGVILGSFQDCGAVDDVYSVVKDAFSHTGVPILTGFEFGHGTENITIPIGIEAELNTEEGGLRFQEAAVEDTK